MRLGRYVFALAYLLALAMMLSLGSPALALEESAIFQALSVNSPFADVPRSFDIDDKGERAVSTSSPGAFTLWTVKGDPGKAPKTEYSIVRIAPRPELVEKDAAKRRYEWALPYLAAISPSGGLVAVSLPPLEAEGGRGYASGTAEVQFFSTSNANGQVLRAIRLKTSTAVTALRFSPDGRYLVVGLGDGCGIRVYSVPTEERPESREIAADDLGYGGSWEASCETTPNRPVNSLSGRVLDIAFPNEAKTGFWLITSSSTGLRAYPRLAEGKLGQAQIVTGSQLGLKRVGKLSLSPRGDRLAVGDGGGLRVTLLNLSQLAGRPTLSSARKRLLSVPRAAIRKNLNIDESDDFALPHVAWLGEEGERGEADLVYAAGRFPAVAVKQSEVRTMPHDPHGDAAQLQVAFAVKKDSAKAQLFAISSMPVTQLAVIKPDRTLVSLTMREAYGISAKADGGGVSLRALLIARRTLLDVGKRQGWPDPFLVSKNGKKIYFTGFYKRPGTVGVTVNLDELSVEVSEYGFTRGVEQDPAEARQKEAERKLMAEGLVPEPAPENLAEILHDASIGERPPRFFNKPLSMTTPGASLDPEEVSVSAIRVAGGIAWGTTRAVRIVANGTGENLLSVTCERRVSSPPVRMNVSGDGRFLVAVHLDGVVRWYRLTTLIEGRCLPLTLSLAVREPRAFEIVDADAQTSDGWGWVAWREDGKFAANAKAEGLICFLTLQERKDAAGNTQNVVFCEPDLSRGLNETAIKTALDEVVITRGLITTKPLPQIQAEAFNFAAETDALNNFQLNLKIFDADQRPKLLDISAFAGDDAIGAVSAAKRLRGRLYKPSEGIDLPEPLAGGRGYELRLLVDIPPQLTLKPGDTLTLCADVYEKDAANPAPGLINPNLRLTAHPRSGIAPCFKTIWRGQKQPGEQRKRKLWALVGGFSKAGDLQSLKYAHEDALDFAKLLTMLRSENSEGDVGFDELHIELFVAAPDDEDYAKILAHPKLAALKALNDFPRVTINANFPPRSVPLLYNDLILKKVREMKRKAHSEAASDEPALKNKHHSFLFYFSGHGYTLNPANPYESSEAKLVLPDSITAQESYTLTTKQITDELGVGAFNRRIAIIDACRVAPNREVFRNFDNLQADFHEILFGTASGGVSYEQGAHHAAELIEGLWDAKVVQSPVTAKGNGAFTLGMLKVMTCPEAAEEEPGINLQGVKTVLKKHFFKPRYQPWADILRELRNEDGAPIPEGGFRLGQYYFAKPITPDTCF